MWMALKAYGVQLEELHVGAGTMTASLIDYLSTLSGLKILWLNLVSSTLPTGTAAEFWSTVFPSHINTLEQFVLYAAEEGEWCFFPHNHSLITKCARLKALGLCLLCRSEQNLLTQNLVVHDAVSGSSHCKSAICEMLNEISQKAVIDMVVTDMPWLEYLNLEVAGPIGPIGPKYGTLRWNYSETAICNWIPTYDPPDSCGYLPWVSVGDIHEPRMFASRKCGMKLVYEEVKMNQKTY
jgi:hypothetical protein